MDFDKTIFSSTTHRLAVVSNRGAYSFKKTAEGIRAVPSVSGLVSAVEPVLRKVPGSWVAWGGRCSSIETTGLSVPLPGSGSESTFFEAMLSRREVEMYYKGFANGCLWPLCHNFVEKVKFSEEQWKSYLGVNEKFAQVVLKHTGPADLIWVHDFHLTGVPRFIRSQRPMARISLFWHIPFPPPEIFAVLPWAAEILRGMMDCEFIGFHTKRYVQNFLQSAAEIAGVEVDTDKGDIYLPGRKVRVAALPIGIDWQLFREIASRKEVIQKSERIRRETGERRIIIGADRLDYTKGIPERLLAIEWLLENCPEFRNEITFVQIAVPSRTDVADYKNLRRQIEETVGRINGKFTEEYHVPVRYLYKTLGKEDLVAHYLAADMALVTPLNDGLNLVAKEYVAARADGTGVLVLSPFAGAAEQLTGQLTANPYSPREVAMQIAAGLTMNPEEKKRRMRQMARTVKEYDINWWWQTLLKSWLLGSVPDECGGVDNFSGLNTGGVVS
ncbi:MAG: trehalose-6-phosphate synthase [Firmicutes bacterium HGW-Firmicutes-14]|nr:MAG: trehalose-6-phosphate synthase [Firmicutes bacterium HGW-Firmicutes-14]